MFAKNSIRFNTTYRSITNSDSTELGEGLIQSRKFSVLLTGIKEAAPQELPVNP